MVGWTLQCMRVQVGPELTERLHAAAAAQSDESRTLYYLPHMQVAMDAPPPNRRPPSRLKNP